MENFSTRLLNNYFFWSLSVLFDDKHNKNVRGSHSHVTYKKMFYKTSQNSQRNTCATFQKPSNCWLPLTTHQILWDFFLNKLWENGVETKSYVKTDWRLILFSQGLLTRKFLQFWQYFAVTMIYSCLRPFWRCSHANMRSMRLFPFMEMSF